jgi:hypothetical protein
MTLPSGRRTQVESWSSQYAMRFKILGTSVLQAPFLSDLLPETPTPTPLILSVYTV